MIAVVDSEVGALVISATALLDFGAVEGPFGVLTEKVITPRLDLGAKGQLVHADAVGPDHAIRFPLVAGVDFGMGIGELQGERGGGKETIADFGLRIAVRPRHACRARADCGVWSAE